MTTLTFLRDSVTAPLRMGSLVPSSPALAAAMVDAAEIRPNDVILELGAGTGAFTREIVRRHPHNRLVAVELGAPLAATLARAFPSVDVVTGSAEDVGAALDRLGIPHAHRVVSGLPWALWGEPFQTRVLDAVVARLSPDARFTTFHYLHSRALGRVAPTRALLAARFRAVSFSAPVWWNFPPALVHIAEGLRSPPLLPDASAARPPTPE